MLKELARSITPPILWKLLRSMTPNGTEVERQYRCGVVTIALPPGHLLPEYQGSHRNYDRFLPHLAARLSDGLVIDVGANCGDTLAAMASKNGRLAYLCIEADEEYFRILESNAVRVREAIKGVRVYLERTLVGSEIEDVALVGSGGTKKAVVGEGVMQARRLDDLVERPLFEEVQLIKVDVDGFDYDVINSATEMLAAASPIVYFEANFSTEAQRVGYYSTIHRMIDAGYSDWTFFDNYGGMVVRTGSSREVFLLLDYLWAQVTGATTQTIAYFDLLAARDTESTVVDTALRDYLK